jgi:hypothetical protein
MNIAPWPNKYLPRLPALDGSLVTEVNASITNIIIITAKSIVNEENIDLFTLITLVLLNKTINNTDVIIDKINAYE